MPGISLVHTLPEDEWRRFVAEHPSGNIFHTPETFQVFSGSKDYQPELWAATSNGQILALMVPAHITLADGLQLEKNQGYRLFDFGGAGKADEVYGPRKFKAKVSGTLVNYGRNTFIDSSLRLI